MNILDKFTSIDDLLVSILERIGGVTEEDTHFFSYPNDGTRATITKGTTSLDFMGGTVMTPSGTVSPLGNSLRARGREYCRSLSLQADRDIIIQIGTKSKIPVFAGTWFKVAHLRFTDTKIIAAEDTHIFVIACTNPDSIEMVGEAYVKDPVDVWGKVTTMGNAELAVRTHAPPILYDRRGEVLRWIDFESGTPNYKINESGGGVFYRSNDTAMTGDFSGKITTDVIAGGSVRIKQSTTDLRMGRIGFAATYATADAKSSIATDIIYYDGVQRRYYRLAVAEDGGVSIIDSSGMRIVVGSVERYGNVNNWSTMKLVVDLEGKYIRGTVFGTEFDLTDYAPWTTVNAGTKRLDCEVYVYSVLLTGSTVYIDNSIVTEGEPL